MVDENPHCSQRTIAATVDITKTSVQRILSANKFHPYLPYLPPSPFRQQDILNTYFCSSTFTNRISLGFNIVISKLILFPNSQFWMSAFRQVVGKHSSRRLWYDAVVH
jgi:hypothetical protein